MAHGGRSIEQRWNLTGESQNSYSGQNAQDPNSARMVQSWLVQDDGQLHRELAEPYFAYTSTASIPQTLGGPICALFEFDQNQQSPASNPNGTASIVRHYFCAVRTTTTVGNLSCQLYQLGPITSTTANWSVVSTVGVLSDAPMFAVQENNLFMVDGTSTWLYDGTIWVSSGIKIPLNPPSINIASQNSPQVLISNQASTAFPTGYNTPAGGGVSVFLFPDSLQSAKNSAGAFSLVYPLAIGNAAASVSSTTGSLLFNYGGAFDPSVTPMTWAQFTSANGNVPTSYTNLPYPSSGPYEMVVLTQLVVPVAGTYNIQFSHDDGAFFGFGPGVQTGSLVGAVGGPSSGGTNVGWQGGTGTGQMAVSGFPIGAGNNNSGQSSEPLTINFPKADTYPLEIDYRQYQTGSTLQFAIILTSVPSGTPPPQTNPYVTTSTAGTGIDSVIGRYYWYDNADQTVGVATESSSSPIGTISGPTIGATINVFQQPGVFNSSNTSPVIVGYKSNAVPGPASPALSGDMVGKYFYLDGALMGTIATVGSSATLNLTAVSAPRQTTLANGSVIYEATYSINFVGQTTPGAALVSAATSTQLSPGVNNALAGTIWYINGFVNSSNNLQGAVAISSTWNSVVFQNANSVLESHAATATSPANTAYLTTNALQTLSTGRAVICDPRCTHWNIYASESDGSQIGQYLYSVPVSQFVYSDTSPFIDDPSNTFLPINRPQRNDPPVASKILTVHKTRQWGRQESSPNEFLFCANEEVVAGNNGDPSQCWPGTSINTVSDMINEISYPNQAAWIRNLVSHLDSLYIGSNENVYPLWGTSVDDFALGQTVAFSVGFAGRFSGLSTTNGLIFLSYDKRLFLYPSSLYASYLAQGGSAQTNLQEIGKPLRNVLKQIPSSRLDEVVSCHYHYGIRDWFVFSFPTSATSNVGWQTWVYDFNVHGFFQLQRGFSSLAQFEIGSGTFVLVGGDPLGNTFVLDDINYPPLYTSSANLPVATFRPALINFGDESIGHVFRRLELEGDSDALMKSLQITCWLDPGNIDNPAELGPGRTMHLTPSMGRYRYSAMLIDRGGAVCKRMLLQVQAVAGPASGVLRGIELWADPAPGYLTGNTRGNGH